jgi:DNA processing protein
VVSLADVARSDRAGILMIGVGVGIDPAERGASAVTSEGPHASDNDPYAPERDAWTVLSAVHGLGPLGLAALLARYGTGRRILAAAGEPGAAVRLADTPPDSPVSRRQSAILPAVADAIVEAVQTADATLGRIRGVGVRVITMEEPAYPGRLAGVAMPPHVLYLRGDPAALSAARSVAVVGTRRATTLGRTVAGRVATALVAADTVVVSGLAFGIDGAAHDATLRAGGRTVAVIGGGHAVLAPRAHLRLADAIVAAGGAVVSELAPDTLPSSGTFPRRNRIISGLSDATVVVEAPARSGALITASWALEQGRACFLVPGPLDAAMSAGCLAFLREFPEASRIVAGIPQLIADLGFSDQAPAAGDRVIGASLQDLGRPESAVATGLVSGLTTVDELVASLDLPVATVLAALTLLERRGLAAGIHGRFRPSGTLLGEPRRIVGGRHVPRSTVAPTVARSREAVLP